MTRAGFVNLKAKYNDRINGFVYGNGMKVFFDYNDKRTPSLEDVVIETIGTTDFLVIPHKADPNDNRIPDYKTFIDLASVYMIYVTDDKDKRVDRYIL